MKLSDLEKHLRQNGCTKKREGGSHSIWCNSQNGKIAPVPRHRDIKLLLAKRICKELEIPVV